MSEHIYEQTDLFVIIYSNTEFLASEYIFSRKSEAMRVLDDKNFELYPLGFKDVRSEYEIITLKEYIAMLNKTIDYLSPCL